MNFYCHFRILFIFPIFKYLFICLFFHFIFLKMKHLNRQCWNKLSIAKIKLNLNEISVVDYGNKFKMMIMMRCSVITCFDILSMYSVFLFPFWI